MGLIYVNPEGPNGNAGPAGVRPRHPRDVPPDGDERRGDRRADRRRPHLRQDATARATPSLRRPGAGGLPGRAAGPRLEEQLRQRQGQGHHHQRARGRLDAHADHVGQQLLRDPVRLRVGAHREPGRRQAVDSRRTAPGPTPCPTPDDPSVSHAADDADDRPRAARRPDLRADLAALPRAPGPVRRGVRQGLVQAAAPRHGPGLALPRPVGAGAAAVAGPGAGRRPRAGRRRGHRRPQGRRSSTRGCPSRSWSRPRGPRRRASAAPTSAAAPTARGSASSRSASWAVNDPARARHGAADPRAGSSRTSTLRSPAASRSRWPT